MPFRASPRGLFDSNRMNGRNFPNPTRYLRGESQGISGRPDEKHEIPLRTYTLTFRLAFSVEDGCTPGSRAVKSFLVALGTRSGDTSPVRAVYIETVVG